MADSTLACYSTLSCVENTTDLWGICLSYVCLGRLLLCLCFGLPVSLSPVFIPQYLSFLTCVSVHLWVFTSVSVDLYVCFLVCLLSWVSVYLCACLPVFLFSCVCSPVCLLPLIFGGSSLTDSRALHVLNAVELFLLAEQNVCGYILPSTLEEEPNYQQSSAMLLLHPL